jgi:adenine phosphoribosyltransferase
LIEELSKVSDSYDVVAGVEARGFILASAIAYATGKSFVPIRKSGKLPAAAYSESFALEYGEATLQIHQDAILPGQRVMLIDDVLATGGTLIAAAALIERCGGIVDSTAVIMEIDGLGGGQNYSSRRDGSALHILL